jgi:hypothetical protein
MIDGANEGGWTGSRWKLEVRAGGWAFRFVDGPCAQYATMISTMTSKIAKIPPTTSVNSVLGGAVRVSSNKGSSTLFSAGSLSRQILLRRNTNSVMLLVAGFRTISMAMVTSTSAARSPVHLSSKLKVCTSRGISPIFEMFIEGMGKMVGSEVLNLMW